MFNAQLINNPFNDPGVYVEFQYKREAILFDLGNLHHLSARKLLKISHIFVSHTHMDHFIGFDHLLRVCLGRDQHISLFGPPGFIKNVENKIGAYTWNLVENYTNTFTIDITELHEKHKRIRRYRCQRAFKPEVLADDEDFDGTLVVDRNDFTVKVAFLDHKIPSLAYSMEEKKHINIKKNALEEVGLPVGPWLGEFKDKILGGDPDDTLIEVWWKDKNRRIPGKTFPLGTLKNQIVRITPGKKISYITDAVYNEDNGRKIIELAQSSDMIFIEASFLDKDADIALKKYHLTAKQAGDLARMAGAKNMMIFHFSPKYKGQENILLEEAMKAFGRA
jgi:ribonuclease Z